MRFGLKSKDLSLTYLKATQPPSILRPPLSHLRELVVVQDCKVSIYAPTCRIMILPILNLNTWQNTIWIPTRLFQMVTTSVHNYQICPRWWCLSRKKLSCPDVWFTPTRYSFCSATTGSLKDLQNKPGNLPPAIWWHDLRGNLALAFALCDFNIVLELLKQLSRELRVLPPAFYPRD